MLEQGFVYSIYLKLKPTIIVSWMTLNLHIWAELNGPFADRWIQENKPAPKYVCGYTIYTIYFATQL